MEGFYSSRPDFIRTAIRNQPERYAEVVKPSTARKRRPSSRTNSREDFEAAQRAGAMRCGRLIWIKLTAPERQLA
ncbi:hypothetical protein [Bradyrhizobium sp. CCGB20]|uniref:hypothetical protein n=1 Tax=Bradyrhizobium sp. CCGB20 TaxID=2949633 RepID=UPI002811D4B4|nr:hypothetical protein [Bradyrhizobium sp. CCGB20]